MFRCSGHRARSNGAHDNAISIAIALAPQRAHTFDISTFLTPASKTGLKTTLMTVQGDSTACYGNCSSGNGRWRASLRVGAGAGIHRRSIIPPDNLTDGSDSGADKANWFRCADGRCVCVETCSKSGSSHRAPAAGRPGRPSAGEWLRQISTAASGSETADAKAQLAPIGARILHHQRDHEDRNVSFKPPHPQNPFGPINHQTNRKSRSSASSAARALITNNRAARRFIPELKTDPRVSPSPTATAKAVLPRTADGLHERHRIQPWSGDATDGLLSAGTSSTTAGRFDAAMAAEHLFQSEPAPLDTTVNR